MPLHPEAQLKVWEPFRNENCELCPLHREAQTVCLMGDGPVPVDLMIIGEAPGFREDEISRPFQGAAGQYLDRALKSVGVDRTQVYITNAAKCRPPDNRTPTRKELSACFPYLRSEMGAVNPRTVLLLGNSALQAITGKTGITKVRGAVFEKDGVKYLPTYHPAAILRNPALESDFNADIVAWSRLSKGQDSRPRTKTKVIRNAKSLSRFLDLVAGVTTPISFDVETRAENDRDEGGLQPWAPDGRIDVAGFCWVPGESYVVVLDHLEADWDIPLPMVWKALSVAFEGKKLVGHNAKFDLLWLRSRGLRNARAFFDTMVAAHLLDENRSVSLKSLSRTFLGADEWEKGVRFHSTTPLKQLAIYNGKDVDYTLRLYHIFRDQLKASPRLVRLFKLLSMPAVNAFVDIEARGLPVDMDRLVERHKECKAKIKEIEQEMWTHVSDELVEEWSRSSGGRKGKSPFRSPVFLGRWFFGALGLPILEVGVKSGRPSTAEAVLLHLRHKHPAVQLLMDLRLWSKYESTYTRNWLERVRIAKKPRVYTSYNLAGTVTGRLSSNMQQVPRNTFIRGIIGARPGWKLIEADFSQIELRLAAMFSGDAALTTAFRNGDDPHLQTAVAILHKPADQITKEERKLAKSVNFGFLYGMGWKKFIDYCDEKYQIKVTESEARAYRDAFFRQYSGLPKWHNRQRRIVAGLGYVTSPTGRIRHLPTVNSSDEGVVAEAERQAINSPVQGLASDLTVLSMVLLNDRLDHRVARVLGNIHDAVLLEVREEAAGETAETVRSVMENLPLGRYFGFRPRVPIKVDVQIIDHWGGV